MNDAFAKPYLEVSTYVEEGSITVKVNGQVILKASGHGQCTWFINQAGSQAMTWEVQGTGGTEYRISVASPNSAAFYLTKTLNRHGYDFMTTQLNV